MNKLFLKLVKYHNFKNYAQENIDKRNKKNVPVGSGVAEYATITLVRPWLVSST